MAWHGVRCFSYATYNRLVAAATLPLSKDSVCGSYAITDERAASTVCLFLRYGNVSSPCWVGPPPFQIRHLHLSDTAYAVVSYLRKSQMWTFVVQFCDSWGLWFIARYFQNAVCHLEEAMRPGCHLSPTHLLCRYLQPAGADAGHIVCSILSERNIG